MKPAQIVTPTLTATLVSQAAAVTALPTPPKLRSLK